MATQKKLYAGAILRETRLKLALTQKDFATALGVSVSYLNQMDCYHLVMSESLLEN
ncbi:MAG: helix-turn-helix transcriptional regulator [Paracoccaceae bacterium]